MSFLRLFKLSLMMLPLAVTGAPTAHAVTITVNFDAINAQSASVSDASLDAYLAGFGITIVSESSVGNNVLVSAIDDRQNYAGLGIVASSAHNVLSQARTSSAPTTLNQAAAAGSTAIRLASTTGRVAGDILVIDTGAGQETVRIASIVSSSAPAPNVTLTTPLSLAHGSGTSVSPTAIPVTNTTLNTAAAAGSTAIRLTSTTGRAVGDILRIGTGANQDTATIASITSSSAPVPNVTLTAPLTSAHGAGTSVSSSGPVSYTLGFDTPLDSLMFTRVFLRNGPSGITYPAWIAEALDSSNAVIDSVGEEAIANFSNVAATTFTLDAVAEISAVRFTARDMSTSVSTAMLDDFVLTFPSAAIPVPASIWLFGLGLAGLGFSARKKS